MPITWEDVRGRLGKPFGKRAGEAKVVIKKVAGPASYTTGGFDVVIEELSEIIAGFAVAGNGYGASIDFANSDKNKLKVKVFSAAGTEVSAGTNLSGVDFTITAFGW